jgi:hypothetical protein
VSHPGSDIAAYALQFLDGPAYEWGSSDVGPVAEFRRAVEAGGTPEEITDRLIEWARADFERRYQAFCEYMDSGAWMHVY